MSAENPLVSVRVEEVIIGAVAGAAVGLAATSPLTLGLTHMNPLAAGIGAWATLQAGALWAGGIAGAAFGGWWMAHQERDSHLRGMRYYSDFAEAAKALNAAQVRQFSAKQRKGEVHGLQLGAVELARAQETRHLIFNGTTGSGKTAVENSILQQALKRGDRVILHDPKGDYLERYYDPKTVAVMGGWNKHAVIWDIARDIGTPALADQFATACIGEVDGQNKSFFKNAATVFGGLIKARMVAAIATGTGWTWRDLAADLEGTPQEVAARAVKGDKGVLKAVPTAFRTDGKGLNNPDGDVFSIVQSGTGWIHNYAAVERDDSVHFSAVDWVLRRDHKNIRLVVLNNSSRYKTAAKSIFSAILASVAATIDSEAAPERGPDEPDGLWFIADEVPQLGLSTLASLQTLAELGRSRGVRVIECMQDESQFAAEVGEAKAKPMLAVVGARAYLQTGAETADAVSKRVGEREVSRIETTSENGATMGKTRRTVTQRVLQPSDVTALHPHIGSETPHGVEMILQIGPTLGRVLVPFVEVPPKVPGALDESEAWKFGTLPGWKESHSGVPKAGIDNDIERVDITAGSGTDAAPPADDALNPKKPSDDEPHKWL